ncbi:branched-chain amino acid ABC transporter substrate-binding protein [Oceanibacterium hippocampi]|uniref:Leucine-, isoleucine-, valine-, threonine-, and alanine-binding protein n=1 Tax=Oceanibacterium hippocampi TaxID=745714 RepID=A0A1Y5U0K3_9PROT|nr:branched-chain amino acid ABC transporter substrate-binding protein [Oceanibacterium hippocampi]SLN73670.1 Leucine-, isoleucine-, valine-, threonine-, and alanine-binding protein precursor [Oceanibacterium hippocampi]
MQTSRFAGLVVALAMTAGIAVGQAQAADTIKIGFIDPLSGPFAAVGQSGLKQFTFAADELVNKKGGVLGGTMLEVTGYDNQVSAKEALIQLKKAIGDGVKVIVQGNSSGVANALTDAVEKHNTRNPDQRILYLNYSAVDPALTNEKCNFWHFRFDANADMKMEALTDDIKARADIDKVYVIGQDYSFGKAVAAAAVDMLGKKRPDLEIVGNELHPIGKVKDFTPYVTKIKASGAKAVITGNWGADMVNLAKAANDIGLDVPFYTYYAAGNGITATLGAAGKGRIMLVTEGAANPAHTDAFRAYTTAYEAKYENENITQFRIINTVQMLARAIDKAGNTNVDDIARALEGMEFTTIAGDRVIMRASDHQLAMPIRIFVHTDENVEFDMDNSGFGLVEERAVPVSAVELPTTCKMKRPS